MIQCFTFTGSIHSNVSPIRSTKANHSSIILQTVSTGHLRKANTLSFRWCIALSCIGTRRQLLLSALTIAHRRIHLNKGTPIFISSASRSTSLAELLTLLGCYGWEEALCCFDLHTINIYWDVCDLQGSIRQWFELICVRLLPTSGCLHAAGAARYYF